MVVGLFDSDDAVRGGFEIDCGVRRKVGEKKEKDERREIANIVSSAGPRSSCPDDVMISGADNDVCVFEPAC